MTIRVAVDRDVNFPSTIRDYMDTYHYNCVDKSILLPYFKKYYVSFFFKLVPRRLTANFITLISSSMVFLSFVLTIYKSSLSSVVLAAVYAFALHGYVVGDHLDGMQAKETATSSPLGQFLDHYLDVYNGAFIVFMITVFLKPISNEFFYLFVFLNCMVFAATYMEELERGELYFGRLNSLEGLIIIILFFISWLFAPVREFWRSPMIGDYPFYWLLLVLFALAYAGSALAPVLRLERIPRQFILFAATSAGLVYLFYTMETDRLAAWLIITLYSGDYISQAMESHLLSKKHKYPDLIISVCVLPMAGLLLFDAVSQAAWIGLIFFMAIYLAVKVTAVSGLVVWRLREHWLWANPVNGA